MYDVSILLCIHTVNITHSLPLYISVHDLDGATLKGDNQKTGHG